MLIQTPEELLVIDFKTDQIAPAQLPERADLYRPQLMLYARAAAAILSAKSTAKWLYFLTSQCAIKV